MTLHRQTKRLIEQELAGWKVDYLFGHGSKHPFVEVTKPDGKGIRVTLPNGNTDMPRIRMNMLAHLRRALRSSGAYQLGGPRETIVDKHEPDPLPEPIVEITRPAFVPPPAPAPKPEPQREARILRVEEPPPPPPAPPAEPSPDVTVKEFVDTFKGVFAPKKPEPAATEAKTVTEAKDARKKRRVHTQVELGKIIAIIMANGVHDQETNTFSYNAGWSDQKVAQYANKNGLRDIEHLWVRTQRRQSVGWLPGEREIHESYKRRFAKEELPPGETTNSLLALLRGIENRLDQIETRLLDLETRPS